VRVLQVASWMSLSCCLFAVAPQVVFACISLGGSAALLDCSVSGYFEIDDDLYGLILACAAVVALFYGAYMIVAACKPVRPFIRVVGDGVACSRLTYASTRRHIHVLAVPVPVLSANIVALKKGTFSVGRGPSQS
jgi:hypothetical protein